MEPERPAQRPGALSELEARLLAAAVGKRLFKRPAEPVRLGRYQLIERIGQGGMSVVFRAHDPELRREVAVKLLHSPRGQPDPEMPARLRREAVALGRLSHPNVVQVFEIGEHDGQLYVAMELVRGATLRAWLAERPRSVAEVVATIAQAGRGLAAAHAAGIVHRDFKPENVLVGADGRVRVLDFGLARASEPAQVETGTLAAPLTRTGTILGTPAFMAPEQLRDPTRADARADQFSFCVLAYEALHGERPFADQAAAAAGKVSPPPAGTAVPEAMRAALLRGLESDPAARWPTIDELLAALERATPHGPPSVARAPASRYKWITAAALIVAVASAAIAWRSRRAALPTLEHELATLLAADETRAAELLLADLSAAPGPEGQATAAKAWASWARALAEARARSPRDAWAHAYVLASGDAPAQHEALLGLARAARDPLERGEAAALIEAEAPSLRGAPELAGAQQPDADARRRAQAHADKLSTLGAPHEVVALARAGALAPAASTLVTLSRRASAPDESPATRPARGPYVLAAAELYADAGDEPRARDLLLAASDDPTTRDAALALRVSLLLRDGRLADAAELHATRLPGLAGPALTDAEALRDRLAALLAARTRIPLRFSGPGASWSELEPAVLRADPVAGTVRVGSSADLLAAWSLAPAGDRVLVDLDLEVDELAPDAAFTVRLDAGDQTAELALRAGPDGLALTCGPSSAGVVDSSGAAITGRAPLRLQLDVESARITCRRLAADGTILLRLHAPTTWPPGPARLSLAGSGQPASARLELTRLDLLGARLEPSSPSALARAGALLVDGDVHAAAAALAAIADPRARPWQVVALARLGRWQELAAPLEQTLAGDVHAHELRLWLRADPSLAPALRQALGEARWLDLFARAWQHELDAPAPTPSFARLALTELGGVEARCDGPRCAALRRARGLALAQIGERQAAEAALQSALRSAGDDATGRALARRLLLDLALVKSPAPEP